MNRALATRRAFEALARQDYAEAARMARTIVREDPNDRAALTVFGRLALVSEDPELARVCFDRVLAQPPQQAATWLDLAQALVELRDTKAALLAVDRALSSDKRNVAALMRLGALKLAIGELEGASAAFQKALRLDGANVSAYRGLCQIGGVDPDSAVASRMKALLEQPKLPPRQQAELHYALAQVYRRAGDHEQFLHHLFAANAKQRSTISEDARASYKQTFARLESAFTRSTLERCQRAQAFEPTPIFIVGMPRSGTTLVEQILAAHPDVASGGELNYLRGPLRRALEAKTGQPFPLAFDRMTAESINALATTYGNRIRPIAQGRAFVTDKTPGNYHVLGLIRVIFPGSRIIHMSRDPMDTCFSILQQPFDDRSPHTCDIDLLAFAYGHYRRQMQRWADLLGAEFLTVQYEHLIASPANEARRIFEHCGLAWRDEYLDFSKTPSAVYTFSSAQVREPINASSIGGWRKYAAALEPLRLALTAELGDLAAL